MADFIKLDLDTKKANFGFVNIKLATGMASKNTLNIMASLTRKNYTKNANDNLTLRNTFTKRNIQFKKTDFIKMKRQVVRVGATQRADYMELQENGGIKKSKSGNTIGMAQNPARGGSFSRLVTRSNYLRRIQKNTVRWPQGGGSKKSRIVRVAFVAYNKNKFMNYSKNIYKVSSFNKINKRIRFKKIHIYNVSQTSAKINSVPMLWPATKKPIRDSQNIFNSQIKKMLKQKKII